VIPLVNPIALFVFSFSLFPFCNHPSEDHNCKYCSEFSRCASLTSGCSSCSTSRKINCNSQYCKWCPGNSICVGIKAKNDVCGLINFEKGKNLNCSSCLKSNMTMCKEEIQPNCTFCSSSATCNSNFDQCSSCNSLISIKRLSFYSQT